MLRKVLGFIGSLFGRSQPPAPLRNKPDGMAWINSSVDEGCGTGALVNRVVRTRRVAFLDFWEIDPPQRYLLTRDARFVLTGEVGRAGEWLEASFLRDCCLTPIPGDLVLRAEIEEFLRTSAAPAQTKVNADA